VKPAGIALAPDGKTVYLAAGRASKVVILDLATLKVTKTIPVGTRPWGVALSADGSLLYTADGRSNQVSVVDVHNGTVIQTIPVGERPYTAVVIPVR
jgi:YVTN family beta-propeller protein